MIAVVVYTETLTWVTMLQNGPLQNNTEQTSRAGQMYHIVIFSIHQ